MSPDLLKGLECLVGHGSSPARGTSMLALAYRANRDHGVPLSRDERNRVIVKLRSAGRGQEEIAGMVGLSQQTVSKILTSLLGGEVEQRTSLSIDEQRALIKLLLKSSDISLILRE